MGFEDKDFIIRQVKKIAEGLGSFLTLKSVKELVNYELSEDELLNDDEIEAVLLVCKVEDIQKKNKQSSEYISKKLAIEEEEWLELKNGDRFPTSYELIALRTFVQNN